MEDFASHFSFPSPVFCSFVGAKESKWKEMKSRRMLLFIWLVSAFIMRCLLPRCHVASAWDSSKRRRFDEDEFNEGPKTRLKSLRNKIIRDNFQLSFALKHPHPHTYASHFRGENDNFPQSFHFPHHQQVAYDLGEDEHY